MLFKCLLPLCYQKSRLKKCSLTNRLISQPDTYYCEATMTTLWVVERTQRHNELNGTGLQKNRVIYNEFVKWEDRRKVAREESSSEGSRYTKPQRSSEPRTIWGYQERWKFGYTFSAPLFQLAPRIGVVSWECASWSHPGCALLFFTVYAAQNSVTVGCSILA